MKSGCLFLFMILSFTEVHEVSSVEYSPGRAGDFVTFPEEKKLIFLKGARATFARQPDGFVWISDIEHVTWGKENKTIFLADAEPHYYLCGDTIPAGRFFELFPYHFYDKEEEHLIGTRINYRLIVKNVSEQDVRVDITGMGTTTTWDHYKTWEGALRGDKATSFTLKPGEAQLIWEEKRLEGGLPWSGIIFGKATGDIRVCDYVYASETDPGIENAQQIPDLSQPPYLEPSFTRGTSDWNATVIDFFPQQRDSQNRIQLGELDDDDNAYSVAIAYSPGGPLNNLCEYKAVEPSFESDRLDVKDPLSGKSHLFFGGNYPIMYTLNLPFINDSDKTRRVSLLLCSNDRLDVDTFAGVWLDGVILQERVPALAHHKHWRVFSVVLNPGESFEKECILIPLGSRWGGMIVSVDIATFE